MSVPPPGADGAMVMTAEPARSWSLAALLAVLAMLGPLSIDLYLPAVPDMARALDASGIEMQQTLSIYLFAYAFMMLWHGALSDALGRRPIVIVGLLVYAVATLGCAIAGNVPSLWLSRALQGLSAGSGLVVGRAIIRDRYHGPQAQKLMSQITLVFGLAPALAPVAGGILLNAFGWRSIFWVLFFITLTMLVWSSRSLPETLPRAARQTLHPRALWRNYRAVLTRVDFVLLALIPTLNLNAFFLYIASAPTFLIDLLGVSSYGFAWLFLPMIAGIMAGAMISGRVAGLFLTKRTVRIGYGIMFFGVTINLLVCWFMPPLVFWHVLPLAFFTMGSSLVMPSVTLILLDLFPKTRGLASSLQGVVQFAFAGVIAGVIAPLLSQSLLLLALGMAGFSLSSLAIWQVYQHRARTHLKELK